MVLNEAKLVKERVKTNNYIKIDKKAPNFKASDSALRENQLIADFILKKASLNTQISYKSTLFQFFSFLPERTILPETVDLVIQFELNDK